jgi:hypothetical protein
MFAFIPPSPLAIFQWLPPGFNIVAEVIVLIGGMWGFFMMIRELMQFRQKGATASHPPAGPGGESKQSISESGDVVPDGGGLPPHILAVVAATCHLVLTRPHRIVSIQSVDGQGDDWAGLDLRSWSREGRRDIFTSHQLR